MADFPIPVGFHPLANAEALAIRRWYYERSAQVSDAFFTELDSAISVISEAPHRWPRLDEKYRRFPMHNFPYNIVYLELPASIEIIAVAHHRRRPGYWLSR